MRRHHGPHAVRKLGRLVGAGRGLALDDRFGLDDFQRDLLRQLDGDRNAFVDAEVDDHASCR